MEEEVALATKCVLNPLTIFFFLFFLMRLHTFTSSSASLHVLPISPRGPQTLPRATKKKVPVKRINRSIKGLLLPLYLSLLLLLRPFFILFFFSERRRSFRNDKSKPVNLYTCVTQRHAPRSDRGKKKGTW